VRFDQLQAERGFSIVELMVATVLGLLLIGGVLQIFLGNRQAQRVEQSVSHIEENGRIAMDLITQDLRLVGYYGCSRSLTGEVVIPGQTLFTVKSSGLTIPVSSDFLSGSLRGFNRNKSGVWSPAFPTDLSGITTARNGSDLLAIYYGQPTGMSLTAPVSDAADIVANNPNKVCIKENSQVLIGNCASTDLITVTNAPSCTAATATIKHAESANSSAALTAGVAAPYDTSAKISQLVEHVYFVAKTGRKTPANQDIYSLFRRDNEGGGVQELIEGVEFMRVLYGEQLDSGNIRYVPANTSGLDWSRVVSIQVGLLTQSFDAVRVDDDGDKYQLLDLEIGASDTDITHSGGRSLRRVYTATVKLRNREW